MNPFNLLVRWRIEHTNWAVPTSHAQSWCVRDERATHGRMNTLPRIRAFPDVITLPLVHTLLMQVGRQICKGRLAASVKSKLIDDNNNRSVKRLTRRVSRLRFWIKDHSMPQGHSKEPRWSAYWRSMSRLTFSLAFIWLVVSLLPLFLKQIPSSWTLLGWPVAYAIVAFLAPLVYLLIIGLYAWGAGLAERQARQTTTGDQMRNKSCPSRSVEQ